MRLTGICAVLGVLALAGLSGCIGNGPPHVTPERLSRGLVIILPGLDGPSVYNASIRRGLIDANVPHAVEIVDWTGGRPGATYAFDGPGARKQADRIARHILEYQREHSGAPVVLIGHSAGGAMAVFAAEALAAAAHEAPACPLAGLITLAPALSPSYDLTQALAGCGGNMVNCYTQTDLFLRAATTVAQNFDGVSGETAGHVGFALAPGAPEARRLAFENLRQIEWERGMARHGNYGGHLGWAASAWVAKDLAPIIQQWSASYPSALDRPAGFPRQGRSQARSLPVEVIVSLPCFTPLAANR